MENGVNGAEAESNVSEGAFFFFLIVTFSNLMESRGRTEGESGVLAENISKDFCSEGSTKEGEDTGLREGEVLTRV